jgi:prevent-host-death family protein
MTKISTVGARSQFSEIVNRAAFGGERILLTRRGKPVAALVPIGDVELLDSIEDREDIEAVRDALREQGNRPPAQLNEVLDRLGVRR